MLGTRPSDHRVLAKRFRSGRGPSWLSPRSATDVMPDRGSAVGNVHYRMQVTFGVGLGKMVCEASSDELVTLTRSRQEALAIDDGHLLAAALNQPCMFQLPSSVRDRRPLYPEHFGEQILRDQQCVTVVAVSHHQQPASPVGASDYAHRCMQRHHDLSEKGPDVRKRQTLERRHRLDGACERRRDILPRCPGFARRNGTRNSWHQRRLALLRSPPFR